MQEKELAEKIDALIIEALDCGIICTGTIEMIRPAVRGLVDVETYYDVPDANYPIARLDIRTVKVVVSPVQSPPRVPLAALPKVSPAVIQSESASVTGDACLKCGSMRMLKTGTCSTCQDCGESGGCG